MTAIIASLNGKRVTEREIKSMLRRIIALQWSYEMSNPDVGMGPCPQTVAREEVKRFFNDEELIAEMEQWARANLRS